jgi:CRP-like cAMP-binding protein
MSNQVETKDFRLAHLFRDLDRDALARIAQHANWRTLAAGENLFTQGAAGQHFYLVKTGVVKLHLTSVDGDEHILEIVGCEHLFAESVLFMGGRYPVSATALKNTRLIAFDAPFFLSLLRNNAQLCLTLMATMGQQMYALMSEIDRLTLQSGARRVAKYILAQPAHKTAQTQFVTFPASKHAIASLLDMRPETLSRILAKLADDGLIEVYADNIQILQPALLSQVQ